MKTPKWISSSLPWSRDIQDCDRGADPVASRSEQRRPARGKPHVHARGNRRSRRCARVCRRDATHAHAKQSGIPHLAAVERLESRLAFAVSYNIDFLLQTGTPFGETDSQYAYLASDWNRDGFPDLVQVRKANTSTGSTELHILSGKDRFKSFLLHTGTALAPTDAKFEFQMADWNRDGIQDLFAIKKQSTGSKTTEVHILNGATDYKTYLLQTGTALGEVGTNFTFLVSDWNNDGKQDVVAVQKSATGTKTTELHILNGASNFRNFLLHTGTGLAQSDDRYEFQMLDWNKDGTKDLFVVQKNGTATKRTEVQVLSGTGGYKTSLHRTGTFMGETNQSFSFLVADWSRDGNADLIAIKKNGTGTKSTEIHILNGVDKFVPWFDKNIKDPGVRSIVYSTYADNVISRADMLQVFARVARDGVVNANEFADLKLMVSEFSYPDYVRVLSLNVINGNRANALFQGAVLGNLSAGSPALRLNRLVDKWFRGADVPSAPLVSNKYAAASGSLFVDDVALTDIKQGQIGDCYFVAPVAAMAHSRPFVVKSMFIDNGDNTWTVRFYSNGKADYVTVNRMLPVSAVGRLVYASGGQSVTDPRNELWVPLLEKAFAQWNETGKVDGRDGKNTYGISSASMNGINAGYPEHTYVYLANRRPLMPSRLSNSTQDLVRGALAAKRPVTVAASINGGGHVWVVSGYDASTGKFTTYNPWGYSDREPMTWQQLREWVTSIYVDDPAGTPSNGGGLNLTGDAATHAAVRGAVSEDLFAVYAGASLGRSRRLVGAGAT